METELKPYDDAYKILAIQLVVDLNHGDIVRTLYDDLFIERMIQKEVREIDFGGIFLDCVIEQILIQKRRMEMMAELDKLGSFFFSNLDKPRLRNSIIYYLDRYHIPYKEDLAMRQSQSSANGAHDISRQ